MRHASGQLLVVFQFPRLRTSCSFSPLAAFRFVTFSRLFSRHRRLGQKQLALPQRYRLPHPRRLRREVGPREVRRERRRLVRYPNLEFAAQHGMSSMSEKPLKRKEHALHAVPSGRLLFFSTFFFARIALKKSCLKSALEKARLPSQSNRVMMSSMFEQIVFDVRKNKLENCRLASLRRRELASQN